MKHLIRYVDAFTDKPFSGNPAGVCLLESPRKDAWMQNVAREINLSETAFLLKGHEGYHLRWFTPTTEVDLCGHATLASAHVLWEEGHLQADEPARFYTKSGILTAVRTADGIEMDFPADPQKPTIAPPQLERALGVTPMYCGKNRFDLLIEIDSEETLRKLNPDFRLLTTIPMRGLIVTAASDRSEFDFVSRFFAPAAGIDEDPVTGSAHCCLGPYWQKRLHKEAFTAYQASERGGVVRVRVNGDRVLLGGQAVTVMQGSLIVEPS